jgi:uncharacterized protein with gpF-like domain
MSRAKLRRISKPAAKRKPVTLRPLHPNLGLKVAYQKKLDRLIREMHESTVYWIEQSYRANEPIMAQDDILPANALNKVIERLKKRWLRKMNAASEKLADYFATAVSDRTDKALTKILRDGGFSVRFQQSQSMKDVVAATTSENVALIKSIGSQYFGDIEGLVMRSVSAGRDMGFLSKELQARYGVTKKRAALIARTQNNMASANMNRTRQLEIGITKAMWRHSAAGKKPRPSHVKAGKDRVVYDVARGWYDPHEKKWIWPGQLINCRCQSISIVPGFS